MCFSVYLSVCLSAYLSIYLPVCLSIYLSICKFENEAILRDLLNFWTWQRQKRNKSARLPQFWTWQHQERNNSARLPQFWKLTTSRTKQFCEAPFENGKLSAELMASYQCVLRFFHSTCLKYCACHEKSEARSYEVLHLSRKIMFPKLKIWCSKMQPLSENQRPDLLTSLMKMSLVLRLPREMHPDPLQMSHACHRFWKCHKPLRFCSLLTRCTIPCACHAKRRRNVQKWSVHVVLVTFWLRSALRATTACAFSTCQLPKVLRDRQFLTLLTCKCASCHKGVHFFSISTCFVCFDFGNVLRATTACNFPSLIWPRWLRTRRFSEPTFRPSGATNYWKNTVSRDFPTFSRTCIFFLLTLSLLWSSLFFSSLLFSDSSHLCFSICPYCRKFDF